MSKDHLVIFDTTLRDGEQSPGASMTGAEKLRIARGLERMGVDVIEAGFAAASPGDFRAVQDIARAVSESTVCSLARTVERDIEAAGEALQLARSPRLHTFIATSDVHMRYKLQMTPEDVLERVRKSVQQARQLVEDVEFSCEDASRSDPDFLCRVVEAAIDAGAGTINIPDTVGYGVPCGFGSIVEELIKRVPNADRAVFSVHCHNDLGLAVANSLAAVLGGARQVECTVNGLGERAGNASLEEIVMAVRTRQDVFPVSTRIDTRKIVPLSRLVSTITGFPVQPNKAIVGANAFAHEAGIHQDGILKRRETYEIMRAQDVGWTGNKLVLGKHSGRRALRARLQALGVELEEDQLKEAFLRFKELADRKHEIFDEDLQVLVSGLSTFQLVGHYQLHSLEAHSTTSADTAPEARVELVVQGERRGASARGSGPVDGVFKAIEQIVQSGSRLGLYSVNAITGGTESQGEVTVRLERNGAVVNGMGADTDIIVASATAYVNALNVLECSSPATMLRAAGV